ncbi:hypothetical protein AXG93_2121s1000 [Marchantia polymorpha subsp. ruderalis]|uniref:Uncharacterized protein n=1 Tax=Marchantia polymorpha subsp. ruderalis TaxID=1480154 RepID=A0A176WBA7_MARPO|nr:hypothetical protein AXG93_2121s1000 [Marchantia polymorpha subsp. ruderalis]
MDYWTEIAACRPGWQSGDKSLSELPVRFISRDRTLGSSFAILASVAGFSGVLTWPEDLLEGNMSADDTPVCEDMEEVVSFAAIVPSPLDVSLWSSCQALQLEADRLVKKAWSEASSPAEAERNSAQVWLQCCSQVQQTRSRVYILENIPLLGDTRTQLMASVHQVTYGVGQPRMALPTFVSYPTSHAYRDGGHGLLWDSTVHQLVEPNADERERAMGFMTGVTADATVLEASRRQVLDQAMDLNCLTWIVSLDLAEQRRLRVDLMITGGESRRLTQFLRDYRRCFAFSVKELGSLIGPGIQIE